MLPTTAVITILLLGKSRPLYATWNSSKLGIVYKKVACHSHFTLEVVAQLIAAKLIIFILHWRHAFLLMLKLQYQEKMQKSQTFTQAARLAALKDCLHSSCTTGQRRAKSSPRSIQARTNSVGWHECVQPRVGTQVVYTHMATRLPQAWILAYCNKHRSQIRAQGSGSCSKIKSQTSSISKRQSACFKHRFHIGTLFGQTPAPNIVTVTNWANE